MAAKAGQIVIDITAGTSKMVLDLESAKGKLREFGTVGAASTHDATAAMRVLKGDITSVREAGIFLLQSLNLGKAVQAIIPALGFAALAGIVIDAGKKVRDFFKEIEEAPNKISIAFGAAYGSIAGANASLELEAVGLENRMAKLMGKRENLLATYLAEAKLEAIKLGEAISKDLEGLDRVLKEQDTSSWKQMFGSTGGDTTDVQNIAKQVRAKIASEQTATSVSMGELKPGDTAGADRLQRQFEDTTRAYLQTLINALDDKLRAHTVESLGEMGEVHRDVVPAAAGQAQQDIQNDILLLKQAMQTIPDLRRVYEDKSRLPGIEEAAGLQKKADEAEKKGREEILKLYKEQLEVQAKVLELRGSIEEAIHVREGAANLNEFVGPLPPTDHTWQDQLVVPEKIKAVKEAMAALDTAARKTEASFSVTELAHEEEIKRDLKEQSELRKSIAEWILKADEALAQMQMAAGAESTRHGVALAGISGSLQDPIGTLRQQQAIERQGIDERHRIEVQIANEKKDLIALEKAESDYELANKKLEDELEEKTAERRREQLNEIATPIIGALSDITKGM